MNDNSKQPKTTQNKTASTKTASKKTTASTTTRKTTTSTASKTTSRAKKPETKPITLEQEVIDKVTVANSDAEKPMKKETKKKSFFSRFRKQKMNVVDISTIQRFSPDLKQGLTPEQVEERMGQDLYNDTDVKYSKSYRSIFVDNICTFFNLLGLIAAIFLAMARAPIGQFSFVIIFAVNIFWSIFQEMWQAAKSPCAWIKSATIRISAS